MSIEPKGNSMTESPVIRDEPRCDLGVIIEHHADGSTTERNPLSHPVSRVKAPITAPVVLVYIDPDSYGGEPLCFPGTGMPIVVVFDGGRYDKHNWNDGNDPPSESYKKDLENLAGHDAHDVLDGWVSQAESDLGIDSPEEVAERLRDILNEQEEEDYDDAIDQLTSDSPYFDPEEIMGENACLPPGDPDCDVLDLCNGYRLIRPARPGNYTTPDEVRNARREWTIHKYR